MNKQDILSIVRTISSSSQKNKEEYFKHQYKDFAKRYPNLYAMACKGIHDTNILEYMLDMMENVSNNATTTQEASVEVGQKLFTEFVDPVLGSAKKSDKPCTAPVFTFNGGK